MNKRILQIGLITFLCGSSLAPFLKATEIISTIAGGQGIFNGPQGVAVDSVGNLYIADSRNNRICMVSFATGVITTIAGNGTAGYSGNGSAASAEFRGPGSVKLDNIGNLYIADTLNHCIRRMNLASGLITTVAGNGSGGYSGDGGLATSAELNQPSDVALDNDGNLYIADTSNNRIRKVESSSGMITTFAGGGENAGLGDGGPATSAYLSSPAGVALDSAGNLYIAVDWRVRMVDISLGNIQTVAGGGNNAGNNGDGGPATNASLGLTARLVFDSTGNLYISDWYNKNIRMIDTSGIITTVAGNGIAGYSGDGGLATEAELGYPQGLACDSAGNLYIADTTDNVIRAVYNISYSPTFSPAAGAYTSAQTVTISCANSVSIYYTLDGSTPTISSNQYTGPIAIQTPTIINTLTVFPGMVNGFRASVMYIIGTATGTLSYTDSLSTTAVNWGDEEDGPDWQTCRNTDYSVKATLKFVPGITFDENTSFSLTFFSTPTFSLRFGISGADKLSTGYPTQSWTASWSWYTYVEPNQNLSKFKVFSTHLIFNKNTNTLNVSLNMKGSDAYQNSPASNLVIEDYKKNTVGKWPIPTNTTISAAIGLGNQYACFSALPVLGQTSYKQVQKSQDEDAQTVGIYSGKAYGKSTTK